MTEDGSKAIEEIRPGDQIWAWNEETCEISLKTVERTYVNRTDEIVTIRANGKEIRTTPNHPFYSPVKGWTSAVKLRAGDVLMLVNGDYVIVEFIQHEILESPQGVYNLSVRDYHTYFVTGDGLLVHNSCNHNKEWNTERRHHWKDEAKAAEPDRNYGAYIATEDNINRMRNGLAPIGWDGYSVQLHHWEGIANNFKNYSAVSRTLHIMIHSIK